MRFHKPVTVVDHFSTTGGHLRNIRLHNIISLKFDTAAKTYTITYNTGGSLSYPIWGTVALEILLCE